jgi:hypothetical protein
MEQESLDAAIASVNGDMSAMDYLTCNLIILHAGGLH